MATVDELKAQGNKAFAAKDYDKAIGLFSQALDQDANNFVLWSNRSAAKAGKRNWQGALEDAEQVCFSSALCLHCIRLDDLTRARDFRAALSTVTGSDYRDAIRVLSRVHFWKS